MGPLEIANRLLTKRLRRYKWYLKLIDELSDKDATKRFRKKWARKRCSLHKLDALPRTRTRSVARGRRMYHRRVNCRCEEIASLRVRHDMIIRRLENDMAERRTSLPGIFQIASVTLAALSVAGVGVAMVTGTVSIDAAPTKLALLVTIVLLWLLIGAYMPRWVKGRVPFMDAGVYTVEYGVKPPHVSEREEYPGELAKRGYAEGLVYDLNVRNRILTKNRQRLGNVHLIIKVVLLVAGAAVLRLLIGW